MHQPQETTHSRIRLHHTIRLNAPKKRFEHTDGSPDILDRIGLPEFLIGGSETEMREDKIGNEAVDMRLQQNPSRFWFDTRGESAGTNDTHHEAYHAVKN